MEPIFPNPLPARRVAAHEAGHALVAWLSPQVISVTGVSLDEGKTHFTLIGAAGADGLFAHTIICLAGMAGEIADFGNARSGPSASALMAARGLAESLSRLAGWPDCVHRSLLSYPGTTGLDLRAAFGDRLRADVRHLLAAAYRMAKGRIDDGRDGFDRLINALLSKRTLDRAGVAALFGPRLWAPR